MTVIVKFHVKPIPIRECWKKVTRLLLVLVAMPPKAWKLWIVYRDPALMTKKIIQGKFEIEVCVCSLCRFESEMKLQSAQWSEQSGSDQQVNQYLPGCA